MSATTTRAQLGAIARMLVTSTVNSLRRRQGAGALVVLPLVGTFLLVELARFGARSADGMARVLAHVPFGRGVHYGALWLLVLVVALVALKYARVVPGRGSRSLFDTVFVRALPVSPWTRSLGELAAASVSSVGVVLLVMAPMVWGLCRHARDARTSLLLTVMVCVTANVIATLVAVALHEAWSRRLAGRALDGARVTAAVVGVGALGAFTGMGPLGAGVARTLRTGTTVPSWSVGLPTRPLVRALLGAMEPGDAAKTLALLVGPSCVAMAVLTWRARVGADLALDAPWEPSGARRWESSLGAWRAELRALLRQAPYLVLAAPAFLGFFLVLGIGARSATGADLPLLALMGLTGWAVVVMGTALTGAASRRWRRVLLAPMTFGRDPKDVVRAVAVANGALKLPLALAPLVVLLRHEQPVAGWYPRMVMGVALALAAGEWLVASALFMLIDPAPDRLTGLSVGAVFAVLAATLPTAGLVMMLSATELAPWGAALALVAITAWSLERAAAARVRWLLDPEGDPIAAERSWPALRAFGLALIAQILAMETCGTVFHTALPLALIVGYGAFATVVLPLSLRAWLRAAEQPRVGRAVALTAGSLLGAINFVVTVAVVRALHMHGSSTAGAIATAGGATRWVLALVAALVAPVSEELFFRGWLQQSLKRDLPPRAGRLAFAMSAGVFAIMHAGEPWGPVFVSGLVAGALLEQTKRLEAPVAFHVVSNSLSVAAALRIF